MIPERSKRRKHESHRHESSSNSQLHSDFLNESHKRIKRSPSNSVDTHPYGVLPSGNLLLSTNKKTLFQYISKRTHSLGTFSLVTDELILIIISYLSPTDLCSMSQTSKMMYIFCQERDFWRTFVLQTYQPPFLFTKSWKQTFIQQKNPHFHYKQADVHFEQGSMYSDILFHSWKCTASGIHQDWITARENIPIRNANELSLDQFKSEFATPNIPVIIKGACAHWPALKIWKREYLSNVCDKVKLNAGGYHFTMKEYFEYSDTVDDDQPLYLFDQRCFDTIPQLQHDVSVPKYFQNDYFSVLDQDAHRPDFRWLIIGGSKSGSSFHKDPNSTSAWNAVINGRKKWILFPPHIASPPGISASRNGCNVQSPLSLMEWFLNYYESASKEDECCEGVVDAGDVLFVPHGWWHAVLNLEKDTIAVTQNYVSDENLVSVLRYLRHGEENLGTDHISGVPSDLRSSLLNQFEQKLEKEHPEVWENARKIMAEQDERIRMSSGIWKKLAAGSNQDSKSFSFGF
mmetsp:Transcript_651/g.1172  ORF Transcript_651/g.1172 Transcript_651/m.1172 type:complete len:516 (+) Transcript_651:60-1607(+)